MARMKAWIICVRSTRVTCRAPIKQYFDCDRTIFIRDKMLSIKGYTLGQVTLSGVEPAPHRYNDYQKWFVPRDDDFEE